MRLFGARGGAFDAICAAADASCAPSVSGPQVSYVVNRNINYTNVCYFRCQFCAFSKGKLSENLRGRPYDLTTGRDRAPGAGGVGAWRHRGLPPGRHPSRLHRRDLSRDLPRHQRGGARDPRPRLLAAGNLAGRSDPRSDRAPTSSPRCRRLVWARSPARRRKSWTTRCGAVICPDKIVTDQWLSVMEAAHALGLRSTATIMFGHVDGPRHWARHLTRGPRLARAHRRLHRVRAAPLSVALEAPLYLKGRARRGPTWREAVLMHAVARLALHPVIPNIQTSWVKMGREGAAACLRAGANRHRRHADERIDHPRRRREPRPGIPGRRDRGAGGAAGAHARCSGPRSTSPHRPTAAPPPALRRRSPRW